MTERVGALGTRLAAWAQRYEAAAAAVVAGTALLPMIRSAARPMWFDELFTYFIARQGTLRDILGSVPADGNPPLEYLLASACLRVIPNAELAMRIPSMVGFLMAMFAVYVFVRRRLGVVPALFAMLVPATSDCLYYASEARPYALLLGFTGLTLVSWQAAVSCEARTRRLALAGVAVGIGGAVTSHHYGVFCVGMPLICGEAARLMSRKKLDWALYGACAAGFTMLAISIPFALSTNQVMLGWVRQSANFWARPNPWQVFSYLRMIEWWVPLLGLAALWGTRRVLASDRPRLPAYEVAASAGLALLLPTMLVVTRFATGYFHWRYAIGTAIGVTILATTSFAFAAGSRQRAAASAALCVPVLAAAAFAGIQWSPFDRINGRALTPAARAEGITLLDLERVQGNEPIVIESSVSYVTIWWYASDALRARLHYLADLDYAVRQPDFLPELSLVVNQHCVPAKVDNYRKFVSTHRHFLVYSTNEPRSEWTRDRLTKEGWTIAPVYQGRIDRLTCAEAQGAGGSCERLSAAVHP